MAASLQWRDRKEPKNERHGEMISFGSKRDGGTGYMASSARVGPSVLVLHEFYGLTQSFRNVADALNEQGFTVLVPDLYDGTIATSVEEATAIADALDQERTMAKLEAAAAHLTANWHPILGVVGFSLGAWLGTRLSSTVGADATVLYYGYGAIEVDEWQRPLLVHLAETDEWEPDAPGDFARWAEAGLDVEVRVYPGTGHWFANSDVSDAYDAEASSLALGRTIDFLRHHLA
ncbi:MAG TPA: dienelactone hydrolase family protein [Actinomycetota bacterium]|nr:dienelactone hydrolase family protein [Actinomycetota bacterium]